MDIQIDRSRDALLTDMGKETLNNRYLLKGESYQDMFARVSRTFADDAAHAQRVYDYMSKLWFMPATPVLSNGGAGRGLPISCFLNAVPDSLDGIKGVWAENIDLASNGGGIGTYWGGVRAIGSGIRDSGSTSGIIPFVRVMDSLALAISQGSLRRGSAAVYIDVSHPEIEEFLEIRKPSGDFNRKSLNLHHGIVIPDAFMFAVMMDEGWDLVCPKAGYRKTVRARELFQKIVETRLATGEPYLLFIDTVNRQMAKHQRALGLKVRQSNLCSEIMLHTGADQHGEDRTAVCCLSSLNAETFDQWKDHPTFIEDVMRFLDNVLEDFINRAPDSMAKAKYSAWRERSVGLGLMGFHSMLQKLMVPFNSTAARMWNKRLFAHIRDRVNAASQKLAQERGPCPDWADAHKADPEAFPAIEAERFSHKMAVAPTASISIICGGTSAGIEPIPANVYMHKTFSGSFAVKNKYLQDVLAAKGMDTEQVWNSILEREGSVAHLDCLSDDEKAVFETAREIDQMAVVTMSNERTPSIDQGQSVNLFVKGDIDKWDLMMLHFKAWEGGSKSLYYLRAMSVQQASHAGGAVDADNTLDRPAVVVDDAKYEVCEACQ